MPKTSLRNPLAVALLLAVVATITASPGCDKKSKSSKAAAAAIDPAAASAVGARYKDAIARLRTRWPNSGDAAYVDTSTFPPVIDAPSATFTWSDIKSGLTSVQAEFAEIGRVSREPAASGLSSIVADELRSMAELRALARSLRADAARAAESKDSATVAERITTLILMSRHLGQERSLLMALTGAAILSLGTDAISQSQSIWGITFTPEQKAGLLASLEIADTDDPCGLRAAAESESVDTKTMDSIKESMKKIASTLRDAKKALR